MASMIMYKHFLDEGGIMVTAGLWHLSLKVNKDFEFRSFGISEDRPAIWSSTSGGDQEQKEVKFFIVYTGVPVPVAGQFLKYLGTCSAAGYVFHLWQDFR